MVLKPLPQFSRLRQYLSAEHWAEKGMRFAIMIFLGRIDGPGWHEYQPGPDKKYEFKRFR
jgi:hypothetical protein